MLNSETKQKINALRDTLVGKIPTPTGQVEQITLALIYKYMGDIDEESKKLGGKLFFDNEFKKYGWQNLIDTKTSGTERAKLYAEGLESMSVNPNLPDLFKDIFKNAYIPFKDPETISMFLKQVNEFNYDHSEDLGDAFEYLLSVMGSQGDAGQFRTPRHIIDFIVDIVEPKKDDRILDPACGTAGFLISAYKYIEKHNKLTTSERNDLTKNFTGYDISGDMVMLSRVNLYLHHFPNPQISEHDTLTSEDTWKDKYETILANPPFMTPKGGIKPHSKFAIKANRSEVLFVDYIMEHLTQNGKAGIIVPEGIIFQSANAYKDLRKMMVEDNYLWGVVSLPSGVFQPYSGVKTSILLFDKEIALKSKDILFLKVENDGFDLGAQRRENDKSELKQAVADLVEYKNYISKGEVSSINNITKVINLFSSSEENASASVNNITLVSKKTIKGFEYNLSVDRYKVSVVNKNQKWPMVQLGDLIEILDSKRRPITKSDRKLGKYPYYGSTGIVDYVDDYIFDDRLVLVGEDGAKWESGDKTAFIVEGKIWVNNHAHVLRPIKSKLVNTFLVALLNYMDLSVYITGVTVPKLNQEKLRSIKIPLPPFSIQQEIVAELDSYQKIIDSAKMIVENWKPKIKVESDWPKDIIENICTLVRGSSPRPQGDPRYYGGIVPRLMISDITRDGMYVVPKTDFLTQEGVKLSRSMKEHEVVMAVSGNPGLPTILKVDASIHDGFVGFRDLDKRILPEFLYFILLENKNDNSFQSVGAVFKNLNTDQVKKFVIPIPSLEIQKQILNILEEEKNAINANKSLIRIYQHRIKDRIKEVWSDKDSL